MMGPRQIDQAALFYEFSLERHVPAPHLPRAIDRFINVLERYPLRSGRRELSASDGHDQRMSVSAFASPRNQHQILPSRRLGRILLWAVWMSGPSPRHDQQGDKARGQPSGARAVMKRAGYDWLKKVLRNTSNSPLGNRRYPARGQHQLSRACRGGDGRRCRGAEVHADVPSPGGGPQLAGPGLHGRRPKQLCAAAETSR